MAKIIPKAKRLRWMPNRDIKIFLDDGTMTIMRFDHRDQCYKVTRQLLQEVADMHQSNLFCKAFGLIWAVVGKDDCRDVLSILPVSWLNIGALTKVRFYGWLRDLRYRVAMLCLQAIAPKTREWLLASHKGERWLE